MISHAVSLDGSEGSSRKQKAGTSGVRRQVQCLVSVTQIQKPSTMEQGLKDGRKSLVRRSASEHSQA